MLLVNPMDIVICINTTKEDFYMIGDNMQNRIRELRQEKKITQLQLSIELDVTQETISAYEHGRHLPSVTSLMKMAEIFDASMDYIMGLSNVRYYSDSSHINPDDAAQQAMLINIYKKLGAANKTRLLAYAQGLLDSKLK